MDKTFSRNMHSQHDSCAASDEQLSSTDGSGGQKQLSSRWPGFRQRKCLLGSPRRPIFPQTILCCPWQGSKTLPGAGR